MRYNSRDACTYFEHKPRHPELIIGLSNEFSKNITVQSFALYSRKPDLSQLKMDF